MSKNKHVGIRTDAVTLYKLKSVASYYGRTNNSHILFLIRQSIEQFEKDYGEIAVPEELLDE